MIWKIERNFRLNGWYKTDMEQMKCRNGSKWWHKRKIVWAKSKTLLDEGIEPKHAKFLLNAIKSQALKCIRCPAAAPAAAVATTTAKQNKTIIRRTTTTDQMERMHFWHWNICNNVIPYWEVSRFVGEWLHKRNFRENFTFDQFERATQTIT